MAFRRGGSAARRLVQLLLSAALGLFFRRIETDGAGRVPAAEPLVFVLNHPNGLIDPALVFCALPRRISFLAKSTLFRLPVLRWLLRTVEALPVYRRADAAEDDSAEPADAAARNRETFRRCFELLRQNRCIAIFPEGRSHDEPRLLPLKTGAARIALGALSVGDDDTSNDAAPFDTDADANGAGRGDAATVRHGDSATVLRGDADGGRHSDVNDGRGGDANGDRRGDTFAAGARLRTLKLLPVGLYYTAKTSFRGEALIRFGEPFEVAPAPVDVRGEPAREAVRELSARIEQALLSVTLNVADDEELEVVARAEQLFSSIYESLHFRQPLAAEFDLRRRLADALARGAGGPEAEHLRARLLRYERDLSRFGVVPENLSVLAHSRWEVFRHFLLHVAVLLLLSPLVAAGALLHLPAYLVSTLVSRRFRKHGIDDIAPTAKILAAIVLVPLTWLALSAACYFLSGWRAALSALPAAALCGYVSLRALERLYDLRGWFKAALLLARRRRRFLRLLLERMALHRQVRRAVEGTQSRPGDAG
jgi:1-acyl-sn-glycerol-3-phosphate acyltransferase